MLNVRAAQGFALQPARLAQATALERSTSATAVEPDVAKVRYIGKAEFSAMYAAADFAAEFDMWLDTSVTISWSLFGITAEDAVQSSFTTFCKCLRDWLQRRAVPIAYVFAHEYGAALGLHSHINLFIPGERLREEFRRWSQDWCSPFAGSAVPRAVRVTGPKVETPWVHWLKFGYALKGFDRDCIVQSARNSPDGRDVMLGDLIPFEWQDPGPVGLKHRVGASRSLGPDRRAVGVPAGLDYLLTERLPDLSTIAGFSAGGGGDSPWTRKMKTFRSRYDDGARDVRSLYGAGFFERVTGLLAGADQVADDSGDLDWLSSLII